MVAKRWRHLKRIVKSVEADPRAKLYMDEALTPVAEEDSAHMELYTQNEAARVAVERERRVAGHKTNGHAKPAANGPDQSPEAAPINSERNESVSPLV